MTVMMSFPGMEPSFDVWWASYPRKVGKLDAAKAYRSALRLAAPSVLLEAARAFAKLCRGRDAQFIPHPATWLRAGRWLDEDIRPTLLARQAPTAFVPDAPIPDDERMTVEQLRALRSMLHNGMGADYHTKTEAPPREVGGAS